MTLAEKKEAHSARVFSQIVDYNKIIYFKGSLLKEPENEKINRAMTRFLKKQTAVDKKFPDITSGDIDNLEQKNKAFEESVDKFVRSSCLANIDA